MEICFRGTPSLIRETCRLTPHGQNLFLAKTEMTTAKDESKHRLEMIEGLIERADDGPGEEWSLSEIGAVERQKSSSARPPFIPKTEHGTWKWKNVRESSSQKIPLVTLTTLTVREQSPCCPSTPHSGSKVATHFIQTVMFLFSGYLYSCF